MIYGNDTIVMPNQSIIMNHKHVHILAIETSCDETAIALIEASLQKRSFRALSNIVLSQAAMHAEWGGVVPNLAKREHQRSLIPLLLRTLQESRLLKAERNKQYSGTIPLPTLRTLHSVLDREPELLAQFEKCVVPLAKPDIDMIAVTQGPGLEPALWVGVNFARALSYMWDVPLVGINHMKGHIFSALIEQKRSSKFKVQNYNQKIKNYELRITKYPTLALLVSGGHTELALIKKPLSYKIIGETLDDAAGEAFDKAARILGLGYPGGPAIAATADEVQSSKFKVQNYNSKLKIKLPRPMLNSKDFDFSFSGLKTAVLYLVRDLEKRGVDIKKVRPIIAKEFQNSLVDVLVAKTIRAAQQYKAKTVLLGGGVAANKELQKRLAAEMKKHLPASSFHIPDSNVTGDNALMIAAAAISHVKHAKKTARSARLMASWKTMRPDAHMRLN